MVVTERATGDHMKVSFSAISMPRGGALVLPVLEHGGLTGTAQGVDQKTGRALKRAMAASRFSGKKGQIMDVMAPSGVAAGRVVLLGMGKAAKLDALAVQDAGGRLAGHLRKSGVETAWLAADTVKDSPLDGAALAANAAYGALLGSYDFDRYRTKVKPAARTSLKRLVVMTRGVAAAKKAYRPLAKIAEGVVLSRNLVSEPGNAVFPETLAKEARALARQGVKVQVLGEGAMRRLGMGALLGVGQGSARESKLIVMQWNGAPDKSSRPIAFVGKGVTFDSGGISLKPGAGMEMMKFDMGGAATVLGLMKALSGRRAKVNAVGVIGAVENMPSGEAQRPGDVVTTMSGQTVEVVNTDAEGRLVLADALWYTQKRFKPRFMVDLATLTGAIIVALGHEYAGLFSNSDKLSERLTAAGEAVGERVWRMPLHENFGRDIDSAIADMKNVGAGRDAGSISAAKFLERFVNKVPWSHLDIAGVVWPKKGQPTVPKGASGFGVRLLDRLVADHYER